MYTTALPSVYSTVLTKKLIDNTEEALEQEEEEWQKTKLKLLQFVDSKFYEKRDDEDDDDEEEDIEMGDDDDDSREFDQGADYYTVGSGY
mmetsp:Transcript_6485/g.7244  ORF Transcript_6485/g.7244 Transcript_6485/m.7244 type:complete len:90 (+) Transcript_6485:64-333(+)|eukprot:CAMPEP_0205822586 /NCGR_PEP_ID=MMETSP0206-20130828/13159_1 /ASSEMBLY_ACC=CAM_ASM_000279 /TAXON_ID=36767 /ORGANISM="Euplotes focardii, Strain TN1" /LENGTH=89 /DNA_ID=CAMNT_0053118987 /DNA_START=52 /DNA_END=321 /DNA_ORIENTATION=+